MQTTISANHNAAQTAGFPNRTAVQIENWLIDAFARLSQVDPNEIEVERAFVDYQLDSSVAVTLAKLLGDWGNAELQATAFWEYPNIRELAAALATVRRG